jgi:hypothetical protein
MDRSIKILCQLKQAFEPYCVMSKELMGGKREAAPIKMFLERKEKH